jgi:hypothetical protein
VPPHAVVKVWVEDSGDVRAQAVSSFVLLHVVGGFVVVVLDILG